MIKNIEIVTTWADQGGAYLLKTSEEILPKITIYNCARTGKEFGVKDECWENIIVILELADLKMRRAIWSRFVLLITATIIRKRVGEVKNLWL